MKKQWLAILSAVFMSQTAFASTPKMAVYVQPIQMTYLLFSPNQVVVPLGATFFTGDTALWNIEASLFQRERGALYGQDEAGVFQVAIAAGRTFKFNHWEELKGFYWRPKVLAIYSRETEGSIFNRFGNPYPGSAGTSYEVQLAADVGYQHTFGHFFIGSSLGLGAGMAFNAGAGITTFGGPGLLSQDAVLERKNRRVFSLNLNILQLGVAF